MNCTRPFRVSIALNTKLKSGSQTTYIGIRSLRTHGSFLPGRFVPKLSRFVPKFKSVRTQTADRLVHLLFILVHILLLLACDLNLVITSEASRVVNSCSFTGIILFLYFNSTKGVKKKGRVETVAHASQFLPFDSTVQSEHI